MDEPTRGLGMSIDLANKTLELRNGNSETSFKKTYPSIFILHEDILNMGRSLIALADKINPNKSSWQ